MPMSNMLPNFSSMADFFLKSRAIYWLTTMLSRGHVNHTIDEPLTPLTREQIAAYVSRLNNCSYCSLSHGCDVSILGGDVDLIDQAIVDLDVAPLDDKLRELFRFIRSLVDTPDQFGAADWQKAMDAGWQAKELESAIYVVGWFQYMNTLATGNLIPATPEELAMDLAQQRQRDGGYAQLCQEIQQEIGKNVSVKVDITERDN